MAASVTFVMILFKKIFEIISSLDQELEGYCWNQDSYQLNSVVIPFVCGLLDGEINT